ncbi:MAG: hypothetical protein EXQ71_00920 [Acidimicrobiia bacterium]|nr:hypothetical protein [Acidimicrobiia bacterium]
MQEGGSVIEAGPSAAVVATVAWADDLAADDAVHEAIEVLTRANRTERHGDLERALVRLRRDGAELLPLGQTRQPSAIAPVPADGTIVEVASESLTADVLRDGIARSGCVLVRGLASAERAARLAAGLASAERAARLAAGLASAERAARLAAAYDAALAGSGSVDAGWYDPGPMPDRVSPGLPEDVHRAFLRSRGSLWTVDSPRMLFELFELIDEVGLGPLMTDFLGERPVMSAIKGTLRRMPPDVDTDGRWYQDGAFLGEHVAAFNCWLALTPCGVDAPGLDIVPKRLEGIVPNDGARYDWAASDEAVAAAAADTPILRPEFGAGDALIFDHLLLHRTGASPAMTQERHAIESWFFAPSAYPAGQVPVLY